MSIETGGPAFPQVDTETVGSHGEYQDRVYSYGGMTLRDYFAAKALVGALANSDSGNGAMEPTMMFVGRAPEQACELLATFAYRLADAMLAARQA